ncbi:MAG TPA: hypothetical protein VF548_04345 [Allosphingosinicella sp.]|jgi:hypothetical protein
MSNRYDPMEEAFNEALEEAASGSGFEPQGFGGDGLGNDGFESDGFESDGVRAEALGSQGENEDEGDAFFAKAFRKFGGLVGQLPLKQLAKAGAQVAGGAIGGPFGARLGGIAAGMLGEEEYGFEGEAFNLEDEDEGPLQEDEAEAFGLDSLTDSLAESLAAQAAESDSEAEASALLGGVTIHIVTGAPVSVRRISPVLLRGTNRLGRFLRQRRSTRPLVKAIPKIQKTAVKMLADHARKGGKVTPATAAKALAKATVRTLGTPKAAAKSLANNAVKSKRAARPASAAFRPRSAIARAER